MAVSGPENPVFPRIKFSAFFVESVASVGNATEPTTVLAGYYCEPELCPAIPKSPIKMKRETTVRLPMEIIILLKAMRMMIEAHGHGSN